MYNHNSSPRVKAIASRILKWLDLYVTRDRILFSLFFFTEKLNFKNFVNVTYSI